MKQRLSLTPYWSCQLLGWTTVAIYWEVEAFKRSDHFNYAEGLIHFLSDIVINITLTHGYRNYARQRHWDQLAPRQLIPRITIATFLLAIAFTLTVVIRFYLAENYHFPGNTDTVWQYAIRTGWSPFIAGIRIMAIWVLSFHLYHYARREATTAQHNAELALIAREAQLNNLAAQLNPHFFFNSLNNIKSLIADNPQSARRAVDLLAELIRHSLYDETARLSTLKEELQLVKDYLELEQLRLEERLKYHIDVHTDLMTTQVPAFSIQILVENAIKHGVSKEKNGGNIIITASHTPQGLQITVLNTGTLNEEPRKGLGLKNLGDRLQLLYQGNARLHIFQAAPTQVSATFLIPTT